MSHRVPREPDLPEALPDWVGGLEGDVDNCEPMRRGHHSSPPWGGPTTTTITTPPPTKEDHEDDVAEGMLPLASTSIPISQNSGASGNGSLHGHGSG